MGGEMNSNLTLWDPDVNVHIEKSHFGDEPRIAIHFGGWPGQPHNTWFMNESDLDILIMKLLDAKVRYTEGKE
jgi:hypothetical protein